MVRDQDIGWPSGLSYTYERDIKEITFAGATPNAIGDYDGTGNPTTLFTITGSIEFKIVCVCTTSVTHAASAKLEVGITGDTASVFAQRDLTVDGTFSAGELWWDVALGAYGIMTNSTDMILTVSTANVNTGVLVFTAFWRPVTSDGALYN